MNRLALIALAPLAFSAPALAQPMDPSMPGMSMPMATPMAPAKPAAKPHPKGPKHEAPSAAPASPTDSMPGMAGMAMPSDHSGDHDMAAMPGMKAPSAGAGAGAMPGMSMPAAPGAPDAMANMPGMKGAAAADSEDAAPAEADIPRSPPPPPALDHAADRIFDPAAMAAARQQLRQEHGGATISMVMANLAEYQARAGGGYRWDGQAWIGGDLNRFVLKSEGEGSRRDGLEAAEVQGLYSRAIGPYFNLQGGVRQDVAPLGRTYATVGFEGLAPYWFDVSGALFLSTKGELLARVEGAYDLRLTQRLILQPRAELNFAAQDTPETRTGSGLSNAEVGLRLRYEVTREFAPYVGVSWDRKVGKTAGYARARGEDIGGAVFVAGVRAWF
jgi:copper resistance protein B